MVHTVQNGDCFSSIAFESGFFWQTLWDLPENAALKATRKNPNVLLAGDLVFIPEIRARIVTGSALTRHNFVRKGVPEKLKMKLVDAYHKPRANLDYIITIDGTSTRGRTDSSGNLVHSIPPNARAGKLELMPGPEKGAPAGTVVPTEIQTLQLGELDPISEISGIKARLINLGLYQGNVDSILDDAMQAALTKLQRIKGLPLTGQVDAATTAVLQDMHGH